MFNEYEVAAYLEDELPEIKQDIKNILPALNIFKSIQCLSTYTKSKVMQHDFRVVKKCFAIADNIYAKGNTMVKDAIENVFVYSFSTMLSSVGKNDKVTLQSMMPICLYTAYVHQVLKQGI